LALHDIIRADGETTLEGCERSVVRDVRDKMTFAPSGASIEGWARYRRRPSWVFAVYLDPAPRDSKAVDFASTPPFLHFENSNLKTTLMKLQGVMEGSSINERTYVETLGLLLLLELQQIGRSLGPSKAIPGGLSAEQLKRVNEFIQDRLLHDISISELAALIDVSQFHFIRAFKKTTGLSPYQYILAERVSRARPLLLRRDMTLNDVASSTGFSGPMQLNRVFRKITGVTPAVFRKGMSSEPDRF
jgi:AraC family transcriptional regulator